MAFMDVIQGWFNLETTRNKNCAVLSSLLFFAGWWLLIDMICVHPNHQITVGHLFIGIFSTLSFLIVNAIKNAQISEDSSSRNKYRMFLLLGFIMGFSAIIAVIWVMIVDFIGNPDKDTTVGVALLVQNILILLASLTFRLGRIEED